MNNRSRQNQHRCPDLLPDDAFYGTDYPPSSIRNGPSVSDPYLDPNCDLSCIRNVPSESNPFFGTGHPSYFDPGNMARPVPGPMNYYGGPPGLNRARNYNMVNDNYYNRNENGPYYGQRPPTHVPYYRDYPAQYDENYPEIRPFTPSHVFYERPSNMASRGSPDFITGNCAPSCTTKRPINELPMANDNKTPQRSGKIDDVTMATSLINEFLSTSSTVATCNTDISENFDNLSVYGQGKNILCGKDGPCFVTAFSKDSIGAGPSQVAPREPAVTSSVGTSTVNSQKSQSGKASKSNSKIPKKVNTPKDKAGTSKGTQKGNKKGKLGSKKSKKSKADKTTQEEEKTNQTKQEEENPNQTKQEEEKKLEDTKQDSINMLSVTISTVMLLAADITPIPDNYISWTYKYLKCIKNCQGQHPANIKKILNMLHVDEAIDSVTDKKDCACPSHNVELKKSTAIK